MPPPLKYSYEEEVVVFSSYKTLRTVWLLLSEQLLHRSNLGWNEEIDINVIFVQPLRIY
jgi:hypothetical protein